MTSITTTPKPIAKMKKTAVSLDEITMKRLDAVTLAKKTINRPETIRYLLNRYEESEEIVSL